MSQVIKSISSTLTLWCVLAVSGSVLADSVSRIQIVGNKRIEPETILSYSHIKPGVSFEKDAMEQTLKDLFSTGYFMDVTLKKEGDVLIINVVENASINKIAFEGNSKLKDDKILEEIHLRPREVISQTKIIAAQQIILELYRRMGRNAVTVEPKIIKLDQNRIDLVFEINEGDVTYVKQIYFVGNKSFKKSTLEKCLYTKRKRWYRFFASDDTYDVNRFTADQQALRQFYFDNGYPDFHIISAVSELSPDQKDFFLTFTINEGNLYKISKINIVSHISKVKTDNLKKHLLIKEGDVFSGTKIENSLNRLSDAIGAQSYAFADIQPKIEKNRESKTIELTFEINEGPRIYIERIEVSGNNRTHDSVIRRELRLHEGDTYNSSLLKRSEQALQNLGFFKKVEIKIDSGSSPDKAVVIVKVDEQPTGELGLSGGWSTLDGPLINAKFSEKNFMGTGRTIHVDATLAKRRQDFDIGITDPYFLGYNLEAGVDIFSIRSTRLNAFTDSNFGLTPHIMYRLSEDLYQMWGYIIKQEKIGHVPGDVSSFIKNQQGTYVTSAVTHSLIYDKRDNRLEPTSGYILTLSNAYAGLGSKTVAYLKTTLGFSTFYSPLEDLVINFRGSYGHIDKTCSTKDIRISDSIFMGADSFRGFEFGGIGPRDTQTSDPLGGRRFWVSTLEAVFPIGLPNEFGVKGAVFAEFGSVWKHGLTVDRNLTFVNTQGQTVKRIFDNKGVRGTVGVGVSWHSPFGPIRVDYGIPVMKKSGDRVQRITFGFSTRF